MEAVRCRRDSICHVSFQVRRRRPRSEWSAQYGDTIDSIDPERAPRVAVQIPCDQIPAPVPRVRQSQRLYKASGWPVDTVPIEHGRGSGVPAGARKRYQNFRIQTLALSGERNRCCIQCADSLMKAWREQLLQFRERSHCRLADARIGVHAAAKGYGNGNRLRVIKQEGRQHGAAPQLNRFSAGVIQPPVVGKFQGNVGIFEGPDTYKGIPVVVRYTWTLNPAPAATAPQWEKVLNPKGAPVAAKWEQAFSTDGGKTWETNWYNELIRDDNCRPTS